MNTNLLFNCMWYAGATPEMLANVLGITPEQFYEKAFEQDNSFTDAERLVIRGYLDLSDGEYKRIFEGERL